MLEMRRVDPDVLAVPDVVLVASGMEKLDLSGRRHGDVEKSVGNCMSESPGGIIKRRMDKNVHGHSPHRDHLVLRLDLCIKPQQPQHWQRLVFLWLLGGATLAHKRLVVVTFLHERTHSCNGTTDLASRQRARAHVKWPSHSSSPTR